MPRIQSTSDPGGGAPFEFIYNPTDYINQDTYNVDKIEILHGAPSYQRKKWDGRSRTFLWRDVGVTSTVDAIGRSTMVDTMRTWTGTVRYFNFQNIDRANENWPVASTWKKARVVDFRTNLTQGGELRYETVRLVIQPEE